MGCLASKILAYTITIINTCILITYYTSIALFQSNCNNCFPLSYLIIILVIGPAIFMLYGYLLAYISWRKEQLGLDKGALPLKFVILGQIMICLSFAMALLHVIVISVSDTLIGSFSMDNEQYFVSMAFIGFFYPIILMVFGCFILPSHEPLEKGYTKKGNHNKNENETERQDLKSSNDDTNKVEIVEND